jgi:hypothetical protein
VEERGAPAAGDPQQPAPQALVPPRGGDDAPQQASQVQTRPSHHDRDPVRGDDRVDRPLGPRHELGQREIVARLDLVDQMVRDLRALRPGRLGGRRVEAPIYLQSVAPDDLARQAPREIEREVGLAGPGRSDEDEEPRQRRRAAGIARSWIWSRASFTVARR